MYVLVELLIIFRQVNSKFDIVDFLKKRVKQYQEKKLDEALSKLKFHLDMKKSLEQKIKKNSNDVELTYIKKEITSHNDMIEVWKKNVDKIKKEITKMEK